MDLTEITKQAASIRADRTLYPEKSIDSFRNSYSKFARRFPTFFEKCCDLSFPEDDIQILLECYLILITSCKVINSEDALEYTNRVIFRKFQQLYPRRHEQGKGKGTQKFNCCVVS